MPRKISIKKKSPPLKKTSIKQKQKQSVVININNKVKRTRTPKIVRVASTGGSLGTTTIYTSPLQLPIYNSDENSLKTLNEGLTNAFVSLQNAIRTEKFNQPALNIQNNGQEKFLSLDEVKLASTTPLVPTVPIVTTVPIPKVPRVPRISILKEGQVRNPKTGNRINIGGRLYKKIVKEKKELEIKNLGL